MKSKDWKRIQTPEEKECFHTETSNPTFACVAGREIVYLQAHKGLHTSSPTAARLLLFSQTVTRARFAVLIPNTKTLHWKYFWLDLWINHSLSWHCLAPLWRDLGKTLFSSDAVVWRLLGFISRAAAADESQKNRKWLVCKESVGWSLKNSKVPAVQGCDGSMSESFKVGSSRAAAFWPRPTWAPSRPSLTLGMLVCVVFSW